MLFRRIESELEELVNHAQKTDSEAEIKEILLKDGRESSWRDIMAPFDSILYVSQTGDIEELRVLDEICREEGKLLVPALCFQQAGMAGPLVVKMLQGALNLHGATSIKLCFSGSAGARITHLLQAQCWPILSCSNYLRN